MPTTPQNLGLTAVAELDLLAKASDGENGPPKFTMVAYTGGAIDVGWGRLVVIDLTGLKLRGPTPILFNHDLDRVVGQSTSVNIGRNRIDVAGVITGPIDDSGSPAYEVVSHARRGFRWPVSVGLKSLQTESLREGESARANGAEFSGPCYIVRASELGEVSFVASGADANATSAITAKNQHGGAMPRKGSMNGSENVNPETEVIDPVAAERARAGEILSAYQDISGGEKFAATAISAGWSPDQARKDALDRLRASRPQSLPAIHSGGLSDAGDPRQTIACALLIRGGRGDLAEKIDARAAQRANDLRARTSLDIAEASLRIEGREVSRSSTSALIKAAFTSSNYGEAVSLASERMALDQFRMTAPGWRAFSRIVPLSSFRVHEHSRIIFGGGYSNVAKDGQFKHSGSIGESKYKLQLETKGELVGLSRRDLIDDNLGQLVTASEALGRHAAQSVADAVWSKVLGNLEFDGVTQFFTSGRGNLDTGADSVLSYTSMNEAIASMLRRTDANGKPIDMSPQCVVVPPSLDSLCTEILQSERITRLVDTIEERGDANAVRARKLVQVCEPRIENSSYTGYSATAWY